MKKFWWGVLVGVLLGTIFLSDQSDFGSAAQEFFSQARNTIGILFSAAGEGTKDLGEGVAE